MPAQSTGSTQTCLSARRHLSKPTFKYCSLLQCCIRQRGAWLFALKWLNTYHRLAARWLCRSSLSQWRFHLLRRQSYVHSDLVHTLMTSDFLYLLFSSLSHHRCCHSLSPILASLLYGAAEVTRTLAYSADSKCWFGQCFSEWQSIAYLTRLAHLEAWAETRGWMFPRS